MNNVEKIIDILFDDKDLDLSIDQCEQIAELLNDNNIGGLAATKQTQDIIKPTVDQKEEEVDKYQITTILFDDFAAKNLDVVDLLADAIDNKYPSMDQKYMIFGKYVNRGKNAKGEDNEV